MAHQRTIRIAVLGDPDTGKTSLISTAANDTFDARPVPTLPPTKLPLDFTPEKVPILLTDTSAKPEDARALDAVVRESDAVVVCFDPKKPATLESVRSTWYPRVQALNTDIPIILACCKADRLSDRDSPSIRERVERVARDLPNVECCLNCSSKFNKMVHDVFYYALKAVLYPLQPLYDRTDRVMRQAAVRALKRVFIVFDQDKDGTLSDAEINAFQATCFGISLSSEELRGIKAVVRQQVPGGYTDTGLTLEGFLFLQGLFIERGRLETVWQVLRRFGYNDQLRLSDELLDRVNVHLPPDQVLELSDTAVGFLEQQFLLYDARDENVLSWEQLQGLFSTAPSLPTEWQNERINRLMVAGAFGAVHDLGGFLTRWRYCGLTDPRGTLANLLYLGFEGAPTELLVRRTRRRPDKRHREEMAERTSALCYVFGAAGSGKSTLLRALAGRRADGEAGAAGGSVGGRDGGGGGGAGASGAFTARNSGTPPLTAVGSVRCEDGRDRCLAMVEVSEDLTNELLTAATLSGRHQHGTAGTASHHITHATAPSATPPLVSTSSAASASSALPSAPSPAGADSASASASASGPPTPAPTPFSPSAVASSSQGAVYSLPDLSRCDVAVFVFDSTSAESFAWAQRSMLTLCSLPGCESLPVVMVGTKDELGMNEELRGRVAAACADLALPEPLPVAAADVASLAGVFRQALTAAFLAPDAHVPDTPARKARRLMRRRLVLAGVTVAAVGLGGYCLYSFLNSEEHGGSSSGSGSGVKAGGGGGGLGKAGGAGSGLRAGGSGGGAGSGDGNALKGLFGVSSLGDKVSALFS
ncbi:hypothetical protein HYH02_013856 [Chlamydomonas schloesseri]|uniref:EF-hand domain-containing protein n=1 Tax=Chlamydomonas schloesseri TaxID=2026947 RepID=A0A835SMY0_9CHLO|nr:hypothetical protein HYH02_013856 [Chlamydomonas schloesseri]|eukprot:KAG2430028.1 hypothetical protein HYH02_013856 [Chlamydomonas schloesseri]